MTPIPAETPPDICVYAGTILTSRVTRMLSHMEGVRHGADIEPVHQMRVWSRRTRAALDIFADCFPGKEYRELQREVKTVTSALGVVRDLDVMIATLDKRAAALPDDQRAGVAAFVALLRERRSHRQKDVEQAMAHLEHIDLSRLLSALLKERGIMDGGADEQEVR